MKQSRIADAIEEGRDSPYSYDALPPIGRQAMWQKIDEALTGTVEPMLRGDICNILATMLVPDNQGK